MLQRTPGCIELETATNQRLFLHTDFVSMTIKRVILNKTYMKERTKANYYENSKY
ncbi:MAG: hypothetical protein RLZZ184_1109 [Cyanobacteriota bacterium]